MFTSQSQVSCIELFSVMCAVLSVKCVHTGLKDLLRELQEVTEWQPFGQHLGLEEPELEAIYEDNQTTEDSRREMLMLWMERDPECSWLKIVNALVQMETLPLAAQIAHKYGKPIACNNIER